jgi:hypothetical protein
MRKRKLRLALAILLLAAIGGLTWLVISKQSEPLYQGKHLSAWLDELYSPNRFATGNDNSKLEEAVRQIGTNGIPTLLRMLRAHDSKFKHKLIELAQEQHLVKINFVDARQRNIEAAIGFNILGQCASNAVPALIQIYQESISESSQTSTTSALLSVGRTGKAAVPALMRTAANTNANPVVRGDAARTLAMIHADPELIVPVLIKCLEDSDQGVRKTAAWTLSGIGGDARAAVPTLVDMLRDPDPDILISAEQALRAINPAAATKAGIK